MRKRRAVVIDDEAIIVNLFKEFFSARDYEVLSFTRPVICPLCEDKGISCNTDSPCADVIITDFNMPGMNGLKLLQEQSTHGCRLIRENKAVMSGYIDEESQKQIRRLGFAFFQKPIEFSEFAAWLDECEKRVDLSQPLGSRRKEARRATRHEVRCMVELTNALVSGTTINISDGGLCLRLAVPLATKQTIHLDTGQPGFVCRTASVQWVNRDQDGSYLAGLSCYQNHAAAQL
jgi:CheY-like chemotaxis protein